jgi:hypothetical protein
MVFLVVLAPSLVVADVVAGDRPWVRLKDQLDNNLHRFEASNLRT